MQYFNEIADRITELDRIPRLVFSASCCERIIELYKEFSIKYEFGDRDLVREMLDFVWKFIETGEDDNLREYLDILPSNVPHGDDYPGPDSALALNVCICMDSILRDCLCEKNTACLVSQYTIDCIRTIILTQHDEIVAIDDAANKIIEESILMKNELHFQLKDIQDLKKNLSEEIKNVKSRSIKNAYHLTTA